MTEIYRIRAVKGTDNASSGKWMLYEDREKFERDLFEAMVVAQAQKPPHPTPNWWYMLRHWVQEHLRPEWKTEIRKGWDYIDRPKADQLIDGEWVELKVIMHPPRVEVLKDDPGVVNMTDPESIKQRLERYGLKDDDTFTERGDLDPKYGYRVTLERGLWDGEGWLPLTDLNKQLALDSKHINWRVIAALVNGERFVRGEQAT